MNFKFLFPYLISIFAIFAVMSSGASAQLTSNISFNITPPNPAPEENTTITLNSYTNNLDNVSIIWTISGKIVASGIGKKSFSLTTPRLEEEVNVVAAIYLPDGAVEKKINIKPSSMILLFQANDSYVPPFYRGKALPSADSEIKVVAMPEVKNISPQNMTFYWKKDYTNNTDGSGYGKNFFIYNSDYLEDSSNIKVTASTIDQNYSASANINIRTETPELLFYKNDKELGTVWENALPETHKIQNSETVEASPYFISPKEIQNPTLVWKWFINDSPISLASFRKNLMPLKVSGETHGISRLKLEIESQDKVFQTIDKEMNVEF